MRPSTDWCVVTCRGKIRNTFDSSSSEHTQKEYERRRAGAAFLRYGTATIRTTSNALL